MSRSTNLVLSVDSNSPIEYFVEFLIENDVDDDLTDFTTLEKFRQWLVLTKGLSNKTAYKYSLMVKRLIEQLN